MRSKPVIICGMWERTPWLLRLFGRPDYRRNICIVDEFSDLAWRWQYAGEKLPGAPADGV